MKCGGQNKNFPDGGYGDAVAYFDEDWSGAARCRPVEWQTPYSIYTLDDYKRCVCDMEGDGEDDCGQEGDQNNNNDSNNGGDNSNNGGDSNNDDSNNGGDSNNGSDSNNGDNSSNSGNSSSGGSGVCPTGYSGLKANPGSSCQQYVHCWNGQIQGSPVSCPSDTLFDESTQFCNWEDQVSCAASVPDDSGSHDSDSGDSGDSGSGDSGSGNSASATCPDDYSGLKTQPNSSCSQYFHCWHGQK